MKKISLGSLFIICLIAFWNCSSPSDKKEAQQSDSTAITIEAFINNSNEHCLIITELFKMSERSTVDEIRDYIAANAPLNQTLLEETRTLAKAKGIATGDTLSARKNRRISKLAKQSGIEFNTSFVKMLNMEQRRYSSILKKAMTIDDSEVQKFISQNAPLMKKQTDALRAIRKKVLNNPGAESAKRNEKPA